MSTNFQIRRATPDDAASIVAIWQAIAAEKIYSAIDRPFTIEEERAYIQSLSEREGIFLAEVDGKVVGFQSLDLWAKFIRSMNHVGQLARLPCPSGAGAVSAKRWRNIHLRLRAHTSTRNLSSLSAPATRAPRNSTLVSVSKRAGNSRGKLRLTASMTTKFSWRCSFSRIVR